MSDDVMTNSQYPRRRRGSPQAAMSNKLPITNDQSKKYDIHERVFQFAVKVARFIDKLPKKMSIIEYTRQLIRSSASIGANLQEADGALSRKDFLNKLGISRRESKETKYWLQLIREVNLIHDIILKQELDWLIMESEELKLILSSIINKTKL